MLTTARNLLDLLLSVIGERDWLEEFLALILKLVLLLATAIL